MSDSLDRWFLEVPRTISGDPSTGMPRTWRSMSPAVGAVCPGGCGSPEATPSGAPRPARETGSSPTSCGLSIVRLSEKGVVRSTRVAGSAKFRSAILAVVVLFEPVRRSGIAGEIAVHHRDAVAPGRGEQRDKVHRRRRATFFRATMSESDGALVDLERVVLAVVEARPDGPAGGARPNRRC